MSAANNDPAEIADKVANEVADQAISLPEGGTHVTHVVDQLVKLGFVSLDAEGWAPTPQNVREGWYPAFAIFIAVVVLVPIVCNFLPGPLEVGGTAMLVSNIVGGAAQVGLVALLVQAGVDPFPYGILYSLALMVLCIEVWFREDPKLINGTLLRGLPFYLFHQPGASDTKAPVPMTGFTRVFGSWHAGGVCLCFFMHVQGLYYPQEQKAQTALALGLLWVIWGAINTWRAIYGAAQFCQSGIQFHSLTGPGCGLCGYLMLVWWWQHRGPFFTAGETIPLFTFGIYVLFSLGWLATQPRMEALPDKK